MSAWEKNYFDIRKDLEEMGMDLSLMGILLMDPLLKGDILEKIIKMRLNL